MKLIKKIYKKDFNLSKSEILTLIDKSNEFRKEEASTNMPSYITQGYMNSLINEVVIIKLSDNLISFSENAGYGGMFEVMGYCSLEETPSNWTRLILKFKMGIFSIRMPQNLTIFFGILGLIFLAINIGFAVLFFIMTLIFLLFFLIKRFSVNLIIKKFSKTFNVSNDWE